MNTSAKKTDIVLYWPSDKRVILLSVPFEPNITKAHTIKQNRYASLVSDIIDNGYECSLYAVEVSSRGLIDTDNKSRMTRLLKHLNIKSKLSELKNQTSKSALISSYAIFNAKSEPTWNITECI